MDDSAQEPVKNPDGHLKTDSQAEVDPEELKSAKEVLLQLTKTAKILKIYLPNNPIYQKFLKDIQDRLNIHLQAYEALRLKIKQYEFLAKGQVVYEDTNRAESLATQLFMDGLRELIFLKGIENDEIMSFLEIIGREYDPRSPDDDRVTLLWERHFTHIRYRVAEDFIEETALPTRPQESAALGPLLEKEKAHLQSMAPSAQDPLLELLGPQRADQASQIFVLSEEEITTIKQQMIIEQDVNLTTRLIDILTLTLRIEKDDHAFSDMVDVLGDVLETLTLRGDFEHSIKILKLFHALMDPKRNLSESQRRCLIGAMDKAGDPRRILELEPLLNQKGAVETDPVFNFWTLLNKNAVASLADLLGRLTQMKMRRVLCEALVYLGKDNIEPLIQRLDDPRWFVVRNIIYILGKIGQEQVIEKLQKAAVHKEAKVRKELIQTLDGMKDPKAKELLKGFLNDPESPLRILAIRSLAKESYAGALEPLEGMIEDPAFESKDLDEKKEIFDALGKIGGERVVPKMRELIMKGGTAWFKKTANEELGLCAVIALKRVGTEGAMAVLQEGQGLSNKAIREACKKTMNELHPSPEKSSG